MTTPTATGVVVFVYNKIIRGIDMIQINYQKGNDTSKYFTFACGRNDFVAVIGSLLSKHYKNITCKYYNIY